MLGHATAAGYAAGVHRALLFLSIPLLILPACKNDKPAASPSEPQCREDVGDDAKMAGRTGLSGAKTGVTTGIEGVKAAGSAGVGLVEGGSDEAKKRWKDGKHDTRTTAREGASETSKEAHAPKCGGR